MFDRSLLATMRAKILTWLDSRKNLSCSLKFRHLKGINLTCIANDNVLKEVRIWHGATGLSKEEEEQEQRRIVWRDGAMARSTVEQCEHQASMEILKYGDRIPWESN
jgi:hypothetical protein